jgi:hypothetical protein
LLSALAFAPIISLAVWIVMRLSGGDPVPAQPPVIPRPAPVAPAIVEKPAESELPVPVVSAEETPSPPITTTSPDVLHEVTPELSQVARERIRGRVHVTVRVLVDPAGDVIGTLMDNPGPSKHFAGLAEQAAAEWKFAPADVEDSRVWALLFVFSRDGVTTRATAQ